MSNRMEGHIRERSPGSYEIRYSLGRDPLTGKRRTVTATVRGTKADAKRELRRRLHAKDEGQHVDPTRLTVAEFIARWETDWAKINVSPKTFERYSELMRKHVTANIGHLPLQKLSALDLLQLYAKLLESGKGDGEGLAARTVKHVHTVLHGALKHAVIWKVISSNPAASASPPRVEGSEVQILEPETIKTALAKLRGKAIYPIMMTALGCGLRRGECVGLQWRDLDLDKAALRVERSVEQTKAGLRVKAPKTKHGRRSLPLPALLVEELRAHRKAQQERRLALGLGKAPEDALVFPTFDFKMRSPDGLTKEWAIASKGAGLAVTFHALRHTFASVLIDSGLDVLTISRRLGHSSPAITLGVYGHRFRNNDDRAAAAIDAAFSAARTD